MPVVHHREWTFHDPLVLVGFPSQGLVGSVAASYLIPKLEMELVATLETPHLPPVASVRDGRALSPVQMYASTYRCGLDGECDQLVVVRADAAPESHHAREVTSAVLEWCRSIEAAQVVCLEGADPRVGTDRIFAARNVPWTTDLGDMDVEVPPDGGLGGMAASMLVQGNARGIPVVCLYTAAEEDQADASAAARLITEVDALVPGIRMDPEPLHERAQELEDQQRTTLDDQRKALDRVEDASAIMYR